MNPQIRELKARAHAYALCPSNLDWLDPGLSRLPPRAMCDRAKWLHREECACASRLYGGAYIVIDARAACIYARYSRAKQAKMIRRMVEKRLAQ